MRHIWKGQNLWVCYEGLPWSVSNDQPHEAALKKDYQLVFIALSDIDDMAEGRDDVDVDGSA